VITAMRNVVKAPSTSLKSGLIGSATMQGLGMLLLFGLHVVLARTLGQLAYGEYAYFIGWINIAVMFAKLGTDRALVRYISAAAARDNWDEVHSLTRHTLRLVLWSTTISTLIGTVLFLLVGNRRGEYSLATAAWSIPAMVTLAICFWQKGSLVGLRLVGHAKVPTEILKPGSIIVIILLLVALGRPVSATTAMIATVVATVAAIALGSWLWNRALDGKISEPNAEQGGMPDFAALFPFVMISVAHTIERYTDTLMVGAISGPEAVAIYSVAARITGIVALGMQISSPALQPYISRMHTRGEMHTMSDNVARITLGVFGVTLLVSLPLLTAGNLILSLFGDGFPEALPALVILTVAQIINTFCGPTGVWLSMTGHQKLASNGLWVGAGINVILNAIMVPAWGATGAAIATAISIVVWNLMLIYYVKRELNVDPTVYGALRIVFARKAA